MKTVILYLTLEQRYSIMQVQKNCNWYALHLAWLGLLLEVGEHPLPSHTPVARQTDNSNNEWKVTFYEKPPKLT